MSTQVTYETDRIFLLCQSTMPSALNFCYVFYCNLKEKAHIRRSINSKKKNVCMRNHSYYFDLPKIRVDRARTTKNCVAFALPP